MPAAVASVDRILKADTEVHRLVQCVVNGVAFVYAYLKDSYIPNTRHIYFEV